MDDKYLEEISRGSHLDKKKLEHLLTVPRSGDLGDLAVPCFSLARKYRKNPTLIAEELAEEFQDSELFDRVESVRGYLNFHFNRAKFSKDTIEAILDEENNFGISPTKKDQTVVVEFSSPNIAKPFGVGHLRSTIIGNALANLYEKVGANVTRINYLGDWGTQFGKLLYGFLRFGDEDELKKDPIAHLNNIYVQVNLNITDEVQIECRDHFRKLEEGDEEALSLWKTFRELSISKFEEAYRLLGVSFDVISGESNYNQKAKEIVSVLESKGLMVVNQNAKIVDLNEFNLGVAILEKSDGTTIYSSRDIATAIDRIERYGFDEMIYEVGQEQALHFKQLFKILDLMGYELDGKIDHVGHGLYLGTDGKKLSSRRGTSVSVNDIWGQVRESLKSHYDDSKTVPSIPELNIMTRAAIIYFDLKTERGNDIVFDSKRLIDQGGNTGTYLLYSYARANSMLIKSSQQDDSYKIPEEVLDEEFNLIKKMNDYSNAVEKAVETKDPSKLASYIYEVSQTFNHFYNQCQVIGVPEEDFRITLVKAYSSIVSDGLNLLGIKTLEKI
jgi:arginyl-tRNA synthetase